MSKELTPEMREQIETREMITRILLDNLNIVGDHALNTSTATEKVIEYLNAKTATRGKLIDILFERDQKIAAMSEYIKALETKIAECQK